jgi:hypothetical protein
LLACTLLGSNPVLAHHSSAEYDMGKNVTVKGTVTQFDWNNPHVYIYLESKDDNGNVQKWSAELGALSTLARNNWRRDTVKPGDSITVFGNPAKDGRLLMRLQKVVLPNGQELGAGRAVRDPTP